MPQGWSTSPQDEFSEFVNHPRYRLAPRITGLFPSKRGRSFDPLFYKKTSSQVIPGTAIATDLFRQTPSTYQTTYYFDIAQVCQDCRRPFIFFAQEQKHWYEELGLGLESHCIQCVECRKKNQGIAAQRHIYEDLFHIPDRTLEQNLRMADACLSLIQARVFSPRKTQSVRAFLNTLRNNQTALSRTDVIELQDRLRVVETEFNTAAD